MKLKTSEKTSSFRVKPLIKKGYYPGKLLSVVEFTDKDGKPIVSKYGLQLIFEFAVYEKDAKTDAPIAPMKFNESERVSSNVIITKFVYHQYKSTKKGQDWVEGEFNTAITPNSAITKILKALGWTFSTDDVDPEEFIGNWVELNIKDYIQNEGKEDEKTISSIDDIDPYTGPAVKDVEEVESKGSPKDVKKNVKHEAVKKEEGLEELQLQRANLEKLHVDGFLTEKGLKDSVEQIDAKIEALKK